MAEPERDAFEAIEIVEVVPPPRALVEAVLAGLSRRVAVPCRRREPAVELEVPHIPGRAQADADRLLERVEALGRPPREVVVALTALDIGNPIFTHFFGLARNGGSAALVSSARLTPTYYGLPDDPALTARRIVLEVLHELGHLVGLDHCDDYGCLMRFASVVEQIDNRGRVFCEVCSADVPPSLGPSRRPGRP